MTDRYETVDLASQDEMRLQVPLNCEHGIRLVNNEGPPCAECEAEYQRGMLSGSEVYEPWPEEDGA